MKVSSELLLKYLQSDLAGFLADDPGDPDPRCFAARQLLNSVFKKDVDSVEREADQRALDLFLKINSELIQSVQPTRLVDDYLLGELKQELYKFWNRSWDRQVVNSFDELFAFGRTGPGKSLGSKYDDFYTKLFSSELTSTSQTLSVIYESLVSKVPIWDAAEKCRAEQYGAPKLVEGSRLTFAPKRNDISRTICIEPSLNMFFELGLGELLSRRIYERYGIHLSRQPDFNRELARLGSIDGSYATIDLSSASDSLSVGVLKQILPPGFYKWLDALRASKAELPDGRMVDLKMVSTMGNGFTFPLETLIFSAVVSVAYHLADVKLVRNNGSDVGNFAVFGDDIIVRRDVYHLTVRLLTLLGFKVNSDKTFVEGPFRESCGSDFFSGHFVRGVYFKSLRSPQDRYVAINLLNDWSATTGISLWNSVQYLLKTVKRLQIPPHESFDAGIHVPFSMAGAKTGDNGAYLYRYCSVKPRFYEVGLDGQVRGRRLANLDGLIIACVAGYIRSQKIGCRQYQPIYVEKSAITPCWGWMPPSRSYRRFNLPRWETAVFLNLFK